MGLPECPLSQFPSCNPGEETSSGRTEAKSPKMKVTESKEELLQSSRGGSPAPTEATDFRPETLLSPTEKEFLLHAERGDVATVRRLLEEFRDSPEQLNINCVDSLRRSALISAIENENIELIKVLLEWNIKVKDALLHAIKEEYVEAVELLLEWEEKVHVEGQPYSWEAVDPASATFTPDITPLILAAHMNNYEIIKILLDRGATLPKPHNVRWVDDVLYSIPDTFDSYLRCVRCGCDECIASSEADSLRHSQARINAYKALTASSLIALSSEDPLLTAFELSWELRNLSYCEAEFRAEYNEMRQVTQDFATALLNHVRTSSELEVMLNYNPNGDVWEPGERQTLERLKLAIKYKQKKFVAHPNVQQLLASIWYDGLPGFRRKTMVRQIIEVAKLACLFPLYSFIYMLAPTSRMGLFMKKPFVKFIFHSSSYTFFLMLLGLASQRAEHLLMEWIGSDWLLQVLLEWRRQERGSLPGAVEVALFIYIASLIYCEVRALWTDGLQEYIADLWNIVDFITNCLYLVWVSLRFTAIYIVRREAWLGRDPYIPREEWHPFDPILLSEGAFAAGMIFSFLKLVHIFSVNPHLGPIQISLGRMIIDILKFFFIYTLVLFAFGCGMNQLMWYYAKLEKAKCYGVPGSDAPDFDNNEKACTVWRRFANLFETSQSLFWASFGLVDLTSFDLVGIKSFTRFWGLLLFGCYSVVNIIVLLNMLIAMMSNSYQIISERADIEWKFARSHLWMSYFDEGDTLPPPFNLMPTAKTLLRAFRCDGRPKRGSFKVKSKKQAQDRHKSVMANLIARYVTAEQRKRDDFGITEDDVIEIRHDISTLRYELIHILKTNGMKTPEMNQDPNLVSKKGKVMERRLIKDFQIGVVEGILREVLSQEKDNDDVFTKLARVFRRRGSGTGGRKDWNALVRKSSMSKDPIGSTEERQERLLKQSIRRYIIDKTANVESFDPEKLIEYNPNLSTMIPAARVAFVKFNIKKIRQDYAEEEKSMTKENADEGGHSVLDTASPEPTAVITEAVDARKPESSGIKIETKTKSTSVVVNEESSETLSRPALSNTSIHESLSENYLRVARTSEEVNNSTLPTVDNTVNEPLDEGKHPDLEEEKRCLRPAKPGGFLLSFYFPRRHFGREMVENAKTHVEVGMEPEKKKNSLAMPSLPKSLSLEEKKYLVAVERGDMANVRRMLQKAYWKHHIDINCVDPLGRGAISLAIDGENLEMLELLVVMGVETGDALLQAISVEFVEAVEFLLEHEELIHKEGEPYSWEKVDWNMGTFSPDITPIILAAHRNNYEIIKILLDRGATLPMPHDVRCGCDICIKEFAEDSLRFSLSRINEYRALASPSLIALSSNDPILTAFQLSWELRNLAFTEQEAKTEYLELRRQCQQFAVDLLRQTRSSQELAIILNHDPESVPYEDGEHMKLARLELAIHMKQKKFVAHPNVQQLLAALWYDGLPGFRRKSAISKCAEIVKVAILFPFYCFLYLVAPETPTGKLMRKPFMKFLIHASSYLFFLFVLILVSQSADTLVIKYLGTEAMKKQLDEKMRKQRGNPPTALEWLVIAYVLATLTTVLIGFIWEEIMEMYRGGLDEYLRDMWNVIDFTRNLLYVLVILLRMVAYIQQNAEMSASPSSAFVPREDWHDFDPQLVSEGLFAAANIFSALKLIKIFSINPHLGPLQISVGRMVIDIIKFFFIYSLVLFSFACGLNQLLGYFAELERRKCYVLPGNLPDWDGHGDACMKWRRFGNLFESSQSLFWASFGMVGIDSFELTGIKAYTRFWGLLMFGSYSVINIIVLLNLLIAMMSNSYATIEEHSDTEWKFARTRLWMSYFEESSTLPPPFNIIPAPKLFFKKLGLRKVDKLRRKSSERKSQEKERDSRHTAVMRALVWRYVSNQHRQAEEGPVTEDHINELKGEVTTAKFEMLEVMARNGMDVSSARMSPKHGGAAGKKMKVWERQLMKNFQVAPVAGEEEVEEMLKTPPENEEPLARFRRIAKLAVHRSNERRWGEVVEGICEMSQIGRSTTRDALKNQQSLQKAMAEAKKLISCRPNTEEIVTEFPSIKTPELIGGTLKDLIQEFREESKFLAYGSSIFHKKEPQTPFITVTVSEAREKGQNSSNESTLCSDLRSEGFPPGTSPMAIQGVGNPSPPRGKAVDVRTVERQPKYGWL